jgi:hypothetical protein
MKLMRSFVIQFLVFVFLVAFVVANARGEMMSWGVERIRGKVSLGQRLEHGC